MFIMINVTSQISNILVKRSILSVEVSRKVFNTIGTWIPAIGLFALGFVSDNVTWAIVLLTLSIGMNAATHSGFVINHMDISPNFAGTLVGTCIAIGNIMSILSPIFAGYIISDTVNSFLCFIFFPFFLFYFMFDFLA